MRPSPSPAPLRPAMTLLSLAGLVALLALPAASAHVPLPPHPDLPSVAPPGLACANATCLKDWTFEAAGEGIRAGFANGATALGYAFALGAHALCHAFGGC